MRSSQCLPLAILASAFVFHGSISHAQDAHYWTQQYGARAELLGGITVGSLTDVSSTFYNPGALGLADRTEYLQAAEPFEVQHIVVKDGTSQNDDLSSLSLRGAPSLFAGLLPFNWLGGQWAYSTLTRQQFRWSLKNRVRTAGDFLPDPGLEDYAGEATFRQELSELWAGLTWSYPLQERIGIGVTHYFTYRGQNSRSQTIAQVTADSGNGASATVIDDFDYWMLGLVWKAGIAFDYTPMSFGITLTTPDVDFFSTGSAFFNRNVTNIDFDENGMGTSITVTDYLSGLSATHNSPMSVSAGWAYRFRSSGVHVGAEWFKRIPSYVVMDGGVGDQIGGRVLARRLADEAKGIVNFGVGLEHTFNDRIMYFGSFRTDFSTHVPGSDANLSITRWNLYHISSGAKFGFSSVDVTLGLTYAFGRDELSSTINLNDAAKDNLFIGRPTTVNVHYQSFRFLFGFAFRSAS